MRPFVLFLFLTSAAFGQDLSRAFKLTNTAIPTGLMEIATTLRTVLDVKQLSIDPQVATITVMGSPSQIAAAEWLIPKLDVVPGSAPNPQRYSYEGDAMAIYELKNATTTINMQEILTTLRTVADIQKIYQSTGPRMLILRADPSHMAMADFLIPQLDHPPSTRTIATFQTLQSTGVPGNTLMVYGLAHTNSPSGLQQTLTNLRVVLSIQKIYQQTPAALLAIRGEPAQIQLAQWLLSKLDTAAPGETGNQMQVPGGKDDVIRIFYLPTGADVQGAFKSLSASMKIPVSYPQTTPPAIVVRSTADQVALAGRLLAGTPAAQ